jgi:hypothetical protein
MTDIFDSLNSDELNGNNLPVDNGRKIDLVDLIYEGRGSTPVASTTDSAFPERLRSGTKDLDFFPEEDRENRISLNTSGWEQAGQAIYNTAVEATVGTLEGAALLPGVDSLLGAIGESETGYGNFLSDIFADIKEGMKADVYQTQQAREGFAPMDGSWWASNADTLASTLTLMIPAMGMTRLLGSIGRIGKLAAMRNPSIAQGMIGNANTIGKIEKGAEIVGASAIQRWTENTMEAQGTFEDTYQEALSMGMSEDVAREKAGNAAAKTWGAGWANMAQDVFQFGTIGRGIGKFSSRSAKQLAAQAAKGLPRRGAEAVGRIGLTMGSEALEEADQYVISQESKKSELDDDYKFSGLYDRLVNDYMEDPEFHTSMFFGALGGGVFKAAGDVIENRIEKRNQQVVKERKEKLNSILNDDYVKENGLDASLIFNKTMAYIEMEALDDLKDNINLEITKADTELENEGYTTQEERDAYRKKLSEGLEDIDFIADTYMSSNNQFRDPLVVRTEVAMEYALRKNGRNLKNIESLHSKLVAESLAADATQEQLSRIADIDRVTSLRTFLDILKTDSEQVKNPEEVKTFIKERLKTLTDEIKTRLPEGMDMETYLKHDKDTAISNREMHTKNIAAQEATKVQMEDFRNELELTKGNDVEIIAERQRQAVLNKTKDDIRSNRMTPEEMVDNGILENKDKSFNDFLDTIVEQQNDTDVPTGENRTDKIQERYSGKNLLFVKEMKEMFSKGVNNSDVSNLEAFTAKYESDKKFQEDVNRFYDNKAKELGTYYNVTDLIIEDVNSTVEPQSYGANTVNKGTEGTEQNLINSLHVALVKYDKKAGMVEFQGYGDIKSMTIQDYRLEHSDNYLYEGWTPVYRADGSMVPNSFNQFTDTNGNTVTIVSEETQRILNDPNIQFIGQSVRYKVYPDHLTFNPTSAPSNFLIGVEVEYEGEWITVGRLTARKNKKKPELFAKSEAIRKAVLEHYKRTGETSVDLGSKVTTKQNGFIRRNPKAIKSNKQPYHTVLGNDAILGVILPENNSSFEIKYGQLKDSEGLLVQKPSAALGFHIGDTVVLVKQANGFHIPVKVFTRKAKDVQLINDREGYTTFADKVIAKLEDFHNSDHSEESLNYLYTQIDPIIYLRIERTKNGNYKYLKQNKGKAEWSEEMTFAELKNYVRDTKAMRVDVSRLNDPKYNEYLQFYNILETDIAPNDTIIGASIAIDLHKNDTRTEEQKVEDKKKSTAKVSQKPNVEATEDVTLIQDLFPDDELGILNEKLDAGSINELKELSIEEIANQLPNLENISDEQLFSLVEGLVIPTFQGFKQIAILGNNVKPGLYQYDSVIAAIAQKVSEDTYDRFIKLLNTNYEDRKDGSNWLQKYHNKSEEIKKEEPNINDSKFDIFGDTELYRTKEGVTDRSPITESEKEWFAKYYPGNDVQVVDDLSTVTRKGGTELYGMFRNGIVYLSSDAATGTLRHEAFHLVFNSMLSDKERKDILAQQRFRKSEDIPKSATDIDVEETLSDEFMDVKLTGGEIINTFTGKIKDFFKRLWNIAQIFLERRGLRQGPSIDTLFYRVNRGLYNNFPKFQRNVTRFRKNVYGDLSVSEAKMASQIIASNLVNNFIGVKLREYYNMPDADTIDILKRANLYLNPKKRKKGDEGKNGFDFNDLLLAVYGSLNRQRNNMPDGIDKDNVTRILNALAYVDENGIPRLRELRNLIAGELQNYGIKTSVSNLNDTVATYLVEDEDGVAEEHTDESFDFKDRFTSSLKDFRAASRVLFASIPNSKRQFAGFGLYHEPAVVYNTLKKALESSLSVEDMLNKLETLYVNHPDYGVIRNFFEKDRTLITDFYLNFGQRNNTPFIKVITNKDGSKTIFESNRSNVTSDLRSDWRETFINDSDYYDVSTGTISEIGYRKAETAVTEIDNFIKEVKGADVLTDEQADTFIGFLRDVGIRQDSDTIKKIVTSPKGSEKMRSIFRPLKGKGLEEFYKMLSRGNNPFEVSDETEGEGSSLEMSKILNSISFTLSRMFPEMRSSMFQNGKGKSVDSNLLPRDSMRRLLRWKADPSTITGMHIDPFWSDSRFLNTGYYGTPQNTSPSGLFTENIQDIQLAIFDTSESGRGNHREYSELTAKNFHSSLINLFFSYGKNRTTTDEFGEKHTVLGSESKFGWFGMPIPSDSTAYNIIRFPKSDTKTAIEYIADAVNNETMRIKWLEGLIAANQEAYNEWMKLPLKEKKSNKPEAFKDIPFNLLLNGLKYQSFPELNEGNRAKNFENYGTFETAVKEAYENYRKRFYQDLVDKNVLEYDSKSATYKVLDTDLDYRIYGTKKGKNIEQDPNKIVNNLNRFLANATLVNIQTAFLFAGDIANYKTIGKTGDVSVEDFFKRVKQINSPGTYLNPEAEFVNAEGTVIKGREKYRVAIIADHDGMTSDNLDTILAIQEDYVRNVLNYNEVDVKAHMDFIRSKYTTMNITDAFTVIDPYRYREIAIQAGKWSMVKEDVYQRMMKDEYIDPKEMEIFQPFKPFRYNIEFIGGVYVPVQHKNAEMLITPQMAKYNSVHKTLMEKMGYTFKKDGSFTFDTKGRDDNKYIDAGMYNSSVKVGELRTFANESSIVPFETQLFNNEDYRIQMGTPEHFVDALINIGSQVRKLIIEEFDTKDDTKTYVINGLNDGQPMTSSEIINKYNELLSKNLEDSYNDVRSIFKNEDGTLNRDRMVEELKKFIIERELGTDYLEAVELIGDSPAIPYWYPTISYNLQAIFSAFYKNNITKQQMKGMALFNSSSVGYNAEGVIKKPKIVFGKDGNIDHIEALIPAHSNRLMKFIDPATGLIDVKKVAEFDERLLKGVFYRIPSEDKYSIVHIKVIGFLPNSAGAQIILPDEITTMAGLDFDIDKMFGMMYETDSTGKTVESSMDTREGRNNMMLDMMYGIMQLKETAARQLSPGNFDNLTAVKENILGITQEDSSLNFASQNSKVEVQQRNMMGKELIGVFANHRVNHILFTFGDFELRDAIRFNGKSLTSLSERISPYDQKPIGQRLATFVAAVVDNAKDPIASMLNLVPFLSDTAAMMIRVGYSELTVGRFLKQKVFLDLTNDFTNSSDFGPAAVMKLLKAQKKNIEDTEQFSEERMKELRSMDITDKILEDNLRKPDNRINWILVDKMMVMYEQAELLRKMMSTMRYDSTGKAAGPTYFDTQAKTLEYTDIANSKDTLITGYSDFMKNEDLQWVRDFYTLGVENSLSDMREAMELPYENGVFSKTKDYFNLWKPKGSLKASELNMITNAVFTVNAASFRPFGIERSVDIIRNFPNRFQTFKNANPEYSLITQLITIEDGKESTTRFSVPFKMLKFNRQGITPNHMQNIRDQWTEMMESENEEVRNFAQDLAAYTFFTSGFMFRKNSLNDAIPVTWMTTMTDENGKTFLQHMKDMNNSDSLNETQKEEIVRNIYQSMDVFPEIDFNAKESGVEIVLNNVSGLYEGSIITNDRSFVKTVDNQKIYSPYVRLRLDGDIRLLKFQGAEDGTLSYKEIQPLGVHNRYVQFSNGNEIIKGVIPIGVSKIKEQPVTETVEQPIIVPEKIDEDMQQTSDTNVNEFVSLQMSIGEFLADQKEKTPMTMTEAVDSFEEYSQKPVTVTKEEFDNMTLNRQLANWFSYKNC